MIYYPKLSNRVNYFASYVDKFKNIENEIKHNQSTVKTSKVIKDWNCVSFKFRKQNHCHYYWNRKKIEIKKIEENNSRQVTFFKRRNGLFKKAAELCVLTGAKIAIIVNSLGGRVFAFGHPNVDALINAYLANEKSVDADVDMGLPAL